MTLSTSTQLRADEDQVLLQRFAENRSSEAFTQLVRRHIGVVYGHAQRLLRNSALAEDVTQAVFLLLAQKAATLNPKTPLVGWLYSVTHFTCANARRTEVRRKRHEEEAARMSVSSPEPARSSDVETHLDRILQQLPTYERDALLLRYVHDYTPAEIAAMTHTTEAAAKKRLQRALQKIRERFAVAGVTLPASFAPAQFLAGLSIPAYLTSTTATTALAPSSAIAPGIVELARGGIHMLIAAKMKLVAVVVVIVGIVTGVGGILVAQSFSKEQGPVVVQAGPVVTAAVPANPVAAATRQAFDPSVISGRVLNSRNKPVSNAYISIVEPIDGVPTLLGSTRSDHNGKFSMAAAASRSGKMGPYPEIFADLPGVGISDSMWTSSIAQPIALHLAATTEARIPLVDPTGKGGANVKLFPSAIMFPSVDDNHFHACIFPKEISERWAVISDAGGIATISCIPKNVIMRVDSDDERYAQFEPGESLTLYGDAVTTTEALKLRRTSIITGTLTFADTHQPGVNIRISARSIRSSLNAGGGSATTDCAGRFTVKRLAEGKYVVWGDSSTQPEYAIASANVSTSPTSAGSTELSLVHGGILTGVIKDKSMGKVFPNLSVRLNGPSDPLDPGSFEEKKTDANGRYAFRVPPGQQFIYLVDDPVEGYLPSAATYGHMVSQSVTEGQTTTYDIELTPDPAPSIAGMVVDENDAPVANATVLCILPNLPGAYVDASKSVTTDARGRFTIAGFRVDMELRVRAGKLGTLKATKLKFADNEIVLHVSPNATYTLTVKPTDSEGAAVPNMRVSLGSMTTNFGSGGMPNPVEADGTIRYENLNKDISYSVNVSAPGYGETERGIKAPSGDSTELTVKVVMKKADAAISGTVRDDAGKGLENVELISTAGVTAQSTRTDANGHYRFLVPEGRRSRVFVQDKPGVSPRGREVTAGDEDVDFVVAGK